MPAYEYRCRTCDAAFEVRRSITETVGEAPCPHGHTETSRVFSAVAVHGRAPTSYTPRAGGGTGVKAGGCCGGGCCA